MSLRLYQIIDTTTGEPVEGLDFKDQKLAKAKRRELNNTDDGATPEQALRFIVSPGPDHKRYRNKE